MKYVDVAVRLDPTAAKDRATQDLQGRKYRLTWENEWYGVAEKGNKWVAMVAGAFAQYFKVGVRVMAGQDGVTVVRFEKLASGVMGGVIGMRRAETQMRKVRDDFAGAADQAGLLAGVSEG